MAMKEKTLAKAMSFASTFFHAPKSLAKNAKKDSTSHTRKRIRASMSSMMNATGSWVIEVA